MIIKPLIFSLINKIKPVRNKFPFTFQSDEVKVSDYGIDKNVLIEKGIIKENQTLDSFFDEISLKIFNNKNDEFISALKNKEIALSTSVYKSISSPSAAIGLSLDENNSDGKNLSIINESVRKNLGIGINFSNFENPTDEIKKINNYLKFLEPKTTRPPAAIGLLNISHPKILDFITLKDNANYNDWCMDLSVVIDDDFMEKLEHNDKDSLKIYSTLLNSMKESGEPGIIFSNKKDYICDCCGCTSLKSNEKLTLGQINLSKLCKNGNFDYQKLKNDTEILSRAMKKIDKNSYIGILGYQDLLNQMNIKYGSIEALNISEKIMKTIQENAHKYNIKTAISPTGNTSRLLKTTPSIEPDKPDYLAEIETMAVFQKYLDGNISKTIILNNDSDTEDIDKIIKFAYSKKIKGITVYKNNADL